MLALQLVTVRVTLGFLIVDGPCCKGTGLESLLRVSANERNLLG